MQKQDVDYRSLKGSPSPEEFFLLSRVKGAVTVAQLCSVSGLGREKTIAALERLIEYGLLVCEGASPSAAPATESPAPMAPVPKPVSVAPKPSPIVQPAAPSRTPVSLPSDDDDDLFGGASAPLEPSKPEVAPQKESHSSFVSVVVPDAADLFEPGSVALGAASSRKQPVEPAKPAVAYAAPAMVIETTAYPSTSSNDYDDLFGDESNAGISIERSEPIAIAPRVSLFEEVPPAAPAPTVSKKEQVDPLSVSRFAIPWEEFVPDPDLMSLDVELDEARKVEILYMFANLELMTHYDLFGVEPDADRRSFKKAYFALSKRFHPDLFFRKNVGEFGVRMEAIFKTVTKAFQLLQNPKKRAEYDQLIASRHEVGLESPSEVSEDDSSAKREAAFAILKGRGEKLEHSGAYSDAVDEYRKALALNRDVALILRCAILLLRAGVRLDEAAMYARALLAYDPEHLEGLVVLGSIYERNEMLEDALESYERAVHVSGGDASVRIHVERIKAELSQR